MKQERIDRLTAEAWERHKHDPSWNPKATEADKFWHDWCAWIHYRVTAGCNNGLFYKGGNDPTANTAIAAITKEEKATEGKRRYTPRAKKGAEKS